MSADDDLGGVERMREYLFKYSQYNWIYKEAAAPTSVLK